MEFVIKFDFKTSNNEAEYEALVLGMRIAQDAGALYLLAYSDSQLIVKKVTGEYEAKEKSMVQYLQQIEELKIKFKSFQLQQIPTEENVKANSLSKLASGLEDCQEETLHIIKKYMTDVVDPTLGPGHWPTKHYEQGMDIVGHFLLAIGQRKFLLLVIDFFTKWVEAKPLAHITDGEVMKFVWKNIICHFGLPREIILDNGRQFQEGRIQNWYARLHIKSTLVSDRQAHGQVEVTNRILVECIKKRLDRIGGNWAEELTSVLW
ncbi:UNVERIFIED_CONTAM: Gag-Pol polyprotein [Sesamum angustifolium]|uniref:Gag-Pol polyprotein n=1 Tax=Sesamum angustifolium TaxID=2727405 RepID=A0AAW2NIZ6_9LAMI